MPKNLLFIPGPVTVAEPVLHAMAQPMVDHRGPRFAELLGSIERRMQPIFGTRGNVVILGASGSGGLEAAVSNMFGPTDTLLACPVGVFGQRLIAIAQTYGCNVEILETAWGRGVDPAALRARLEADTEKKITGVLLTHNETSTGVQNVMGPLAEATRAHGAYVVVDSVSGLAASEFTMDAWGFDVVVTASQKALAVPPGLAMVAISERAWAKMKRNPSPRFYFDFKKAKEFADLGQTPWTPPVSLVYALDVALDLYAKEGERNVWARHARYARAIRAALTALDLEIFSADGSHSVTVVAAKNPPGVDGDAIRKKLREERGLTLGGGQKELKGKIIRIGTMGDLSQTDILGMIGALEIGLAEAGHPIVLGTGAKAALEVFLSESAAVPA
ncbi:MAG: alanine--glyoxylate aminotransferase family protein [Candidatus Velthaea sp.]